MSRWRRSIPESTGRTCPVRLRAAEKRLRRLGFRILAPAESFYVTDTEGPLIDGELDGARRWGDKLVAEFAVTG
jgi:hypothetical protein